MKLNYLMAVGIILTGSSLFGGNDKPEPENFASTCGKHVVQYVAAFYFPRTTLAGIAAHTLFTSLQSKDTDKPAK